MARNIRRDPAPTPCEELIQLAIDLDLTALAQSLPALLERAENLSPSFTDFGLQMFRTEVNARRTRRLECSLKRSHLGAVEGLEGFQFSERPKLDPRVAKELLGSHADGTFKGSFRRYVKPELLLIDEFAYQPFSSEATAVATVNRLVDGATILRFTGKSFREPRDIVGAPLEED